MEGEGSRGAGGGGWRGSVLSCAILLTVLWNGTIGWMRTSHSALSDLLPVSSVLLLQTFIRKGQKGDFLVEMQENGIIWGNGQWANHHGISQPYHIHAKHLKYFLIVASEPLVYHTQISSKSWRRFSIQTRLFFLSELWCRSYIMQAEIKEEHNEREIFIHYRILFNMGTILTFWKSQ